MEGVRMACGADDIDRRLPSISTAHRRSERDTRTNYTVQLFNYSMGGWEDVGGMGGSVRPSDD